jgi:Zn-dependent peptidase ImmA (M78 family)
MNKKQKQMIIESLEQEQQHDINNIPNNHKEFVEPFIHFTQEYLQLPSLPKLVFTLDRSIAPMTTGAYLPEENILFIYIKNRALCDYLRTVAHELTHYKQNIEGRIPEDLKGRDEKLEAEANTQAGDIVYNFAQLDDKNLAIYDL